MTKARNAWPAMSQAGLYAVEHDRPTTHLDRVTGHAVNAKERHEELQRARMRYAVTDAIERRQRLGTLPSTDRRASALVQRMDDQQVRDLHAKLCR